MDDNHSQQETNDANNKISESTVFGQRQLKANDSEGANTKPQSEPGDPEQYMRYLTGRIARCWHKLEQHSNQTIAAFTIVIALTGIVYTFFAGVQWEAMITSNKLSQEALESVQRPFLTCGTIVQRRNTFHDKSGDYSIWDFTMPCRNIGPTAANVVAQSFSSDELSTEPNESQFTTAPLSQGVVVGPTGDRNVGFLRVKESDLFGRELPDKDADVLNMPIEKTTISKKPRYFWGWIAYGDVFPKTKLHLMEFCQEMIGIEISHADPKSPFAFGYQPCGGHHNCADEYCEDYEAVIALTTKK